MFDDDTSKVRVICEPYQKEQSNHRCDYLAFQHYFKGRVRWDDDGEVVRRCGRHQEMPQCKFCGEKGPFVADFWGNGELRCHGCVSVTRPARKG